MKRLALGACVTALLLAAPALAGAPFVGAYKGRATASAPGAKPHSIVFKVSKATCAPPLGGAEKQAYCATFSTDSFVQALCAGTSYYYDAFFPIEAPMALSATGRIAATFPLYVADGGAYPTAAAGRVKAGTFQLSLAVNGKDAVGTEHFKADLGGGDGVCDSGAVKIVAHHG